ncbi:DDT domain-containing protein DDB_G0282237 isoform X2 [Cynara cardunculus var. scolymus]|uniref:DDT domain-containing protein DDB_G0282237 isoform X2 n=1 Tax=Cynara cardunculus var. scolymus TaxID=59895 RepID=UPI000D623CF7|nr:DDT domain-containing protein DDB_G0282237 isoform X2 [Cynara cardunculus var. scolymus]
MPLHKRKPFSLLERPDDLKPEELVFQVRFTKEIFRDYREYLKRINLYRQRVWTCKITGKSNLTYEEALVSEKQANEKVQQFPKELMEPVLRDVQFSMLTLRDLVSTVAAKLQERLLEGTEIYGRKNNRIYPCKIVKVIDEEVEKTQYQVAWLDKDKKVTENAVVSGEDLIKKKLPFGRDVLKSFIRDSTCRSVPWVLHDKLAVKYGISTNPPEELRSKILSKSGNRKRKLSEEANKGERKQKKLCDDAHEEDDVPIKYPIDDLLVQPAADDPVFIPRPPPTRDFNIPMECVGDVLMVWDFCCSYSKLLNLSPFSLDDFENALCHKDSNVVLIVESQSALLRLLIKDNGDYFIALQKKKRKPKITLVTWTDYMCDFLELIGNAELSIHISTIRRGHYGLLDIHAKVSIFLELVTQALATDIMREKLDEYIEERQALAAKRRGEALEEGRKRRERKELAKAGLNGKEQNDPARNGSVHHGQNSPNGDVAKKQGNTSSARQRYRSENSGKKQGKTSEKDVKTPKIDAEPTIASIKASTGKGSKKLMDVEKKETEDKTNIEQRKEYLEREIEKRFIRTNPLGKDRDYNRYWFFRKDSRIFVESSDHKQWGYYRTKSEFDCLMGSLNRKGERERALKKQLEKRYNKISGEMQKTSKEAQRIQMEIEAAVRRSSRVRAPPRDNPARAFLKYVNKLKED